MKDKISRWIKKQTRSAGAKGIVLGLSGGLDSAVVCALAKQAVGRKRLLALVLPCHSQEKDLQYARLIARKFGISTRTIELSGIYDKLLKALPAAGRMAQANLKPRLRMLALYYFANKLNYLVCGTGNKSELSAGYFTKYGDGAADMLPIGGLLKRDVVKLARRLKVPECIISRPPTAGLWQSQTDEAEMGITYPELDDILDRVEKGRRQILPKEKVDRVKRMIRRSEHKRRLAPVAV